MAVRTTTHSRRSIVLRSTVASIVCLLGIGSCTTNSGGSKTTPKAGATVTWAKPQDMVAMDPAIDAGGIGADWEMYNLAYDTLVTLDDNLQPAPSLAKSWKQESSTVYVFSLRDAKFSNGRPLTAADVVGSLNRVNDPKLASAWASQLGIKDVTADGPKTVRIVLRQPKVSFLGGLAGPMASILPMKELDAKSFDPGKAMLGSGPYMVKDHVQDTSWTLVRNPYYWGHDVGPHTIAIKIMPEDAARIAALRDGSADVSVFGNPDAVAVLKGQRNVTTKVQETTDAYRIDINEKSSIFSDDRLRQALALSIDRKQIAAIALGGVGEPSAAIAPAFSKCSAADMPYGSPDLAKATGLVAQAGATGKKVTIQAPTSAATYKPIAQVLAQRLEKTGLKVTIEQPPTGQWVKQVFGPTPHFDLSLSYFGGYGDPGMVLNYYNPNKAGFNKAFLKSDPNVNAAIAAADSTPAGAKRDAALAKACQDIASTVGIIPLVTKPNSIAFRSDHIAPDIQDVEAYSVPLRRIGSFGVR